MKRLAIIFFVVCCVLSFQSCYTTQDVPHMVNIQPALEQMYKGRTKSYIIENFEHPVTDVKNLGDGYEILIVRRFRNALVGEGITRFYLKNGVCYKVETNEYTIITRKERVSVF